MTTPAVAPRPLLTVAQYRAQYRARERPVGVGHEYGVVQQSRRRVEWYTRAADGSWQVADLVGDGAATFPCPPGADGAPVRMTFEEICAGVAPPPPRPPRHNRAGE